MLLQREQVRKRLAGVLLVGERVDDGYSREGGILIHDVLTEGSHGHDLDITRKDAGDVLDRFSLPETDFLRREVNRVSAKMTHCHLETDARPQRRLFEQEGQLLTLKYALGSALQCSRGRQHVNDFVV